MTNTNCVYRFDCTFFAVLASLIIGVAAAILRIMGIITATPAFLWVVFGIAVGFLVITFLTTNSGAAITRRCACSRVTALLVGILATILTAVILLAIEFAATSVAGAIITGALAAAFTLLVSSTACIIKCLTACNTNE